MKMIRAIIRPEAADTIADGLAEAGFISMTKSSAFGRGKQKGITLGSTHYDELPKTVIMLVVEDENVDEVLKLIKYKAYTGNFGDGKIFITPVERVVAVRTGETTL
ncbi:P-II family nitrogen regulator [Acetobacterium woodii]|uniref:Nitrogen regulatory protein PII n=1 Tax=Acetobacterium woodii (strain ATCC 29683 / DSM 1030 / JCM 2381 / KCTC 1655 / WB1) TaxID=931626 RepID=H6LJU3_ACEWD|nr:P-II family nitrogen regulator [Acetobacterium woodii]AFA47494.1 nitrogen regulatory protein PII [Acetobacterium woodii DSM 1030]